MAARADALSLYQAYSIGRGIVEPFTVAAPGAGSNFLRTTAQGYYERIITMFITLTTSVAVANRVMALEYRNADGNVLAGSAAGAFQVASTSTRYYFGLALNASSAVNPTAQSAALPPLFLQPGWQLISQIAAIDAADQIGTIRGLVERFGIGPDGTPVGEIELPYTERGRGYARALESE